MLDPKNIFPIGIGTWGIGGFAEREQLIDRTKQEKALIHMFNSGMNFAEANIWYSQGASVEILASALENSSKKRKDIFICQAVYVKDGNFDGVEKEVEKVLKKFNTDFIDTFQFTASVFLKFGFEKCIKLVDKLIDQRITRYTSITNESLELLTRYHKYFQDKLFSHEVVYNFEVRVNENEGTIPYASKNNIKTVIYQPLRRNLTAKRNWPILVELSKKYKVSQNQILLAWLISKGYLPLTKSETIGHIDEHLLAIKLKIAPEDLKVLNDFKPPNYIEPKVDWNRTGDGVEISQLSNIFDAEYDKQIAVHKGSTF